MIALIVPAAPVALIVSVALTVPETQVIQILVANDCCGMAFAECFLGPGHNKALVHLSSCFVLPKAMKIRAFPRTCRASKASGISFMNWDSDAPVRGKAHVLLACGGEAPNSADPWGWSPITLWGSKQNPYMAIRGNRRLSQTRLRRPD